MGLNRIKIDSSLFNNILDIFKNRVDKVTELAPYFYGYKDKKRIKYNPTTGMFICQAIYINHVANKNLIEPEWKQIICQMNYGLEKEETQIVKWPEQITKEINRLILKHYTLEEMEECFKQHELDVQPQPFHRNLPLLYDSNVVHHFHNCVYYDMNGAHRDALCEIFPKAKKEFLNLKDKGDPNTYVGNLKHHNHVKTMWWVMKRTKDKLLEVIRQAGGIVLYGNTDGVVLCHPQNPIQTSDKLGEFKSVIEGDEVYFFRHRNKDDGENYTAMQYFDKKENKMVIKSLGNLPSDFRSEMNLSKGIVVTFNSNTVDGVKKYYDVNLIKKEIKEYD